MQNLTSESTSQDSSRLPDLDINEDLIRSISREEIWLQMNNSRSNFNENLDSEDEIIYEKLDTLRNSIKKLEMDFKLKSTGTTFLFL